MHCWPINTFIILPVSHKPLPKADYKLVSAQGVLTEFTPTILGNKGAAKLVSLTEEQHSCQKSSFLGFLTHLYYVE